MNEKEVYMERIIEMVKKAENNEILQFLYIVISDFEGIADSKRE